MLFLDEGNNKRCSRVLRFFAQESFLMMLPEHSLLKRMEPMLDMCKKNAFPKVLSLQPQCFKLLYFSPQNLDTGKIVDFLVREFLSPLCRLLTVLWV